MQNSLFIIFFVFFNSIFCILSCTQNKLYINLQCQIDKKHRRKQYASLCYPEDTA